MGKLNHPGKATFAGMWNMLVKYLYYFILLSAYIFFKIIIWRMANVQEGQGWIKRLGRLRQKGFAYGGVFQKTLVNSSMKNKSHHKIYAKNSSAATGKTSKSYIYNIGNIP